jgi:uncharacterized damage-inducible protein DinB
MKAENLVAELKSMQAFFETSTSCLVEADSDFAPAEGTWTAAQQVAHVARTIDWFVEGAFRPEGFDMDFDRHVEESSRVRSLQAARAWLDAAFARAREAFGTKSDEELSQPLPEGPVMGGVPRFQVVSAISDHTAHHRGALTVYSRLLGKVPEMPYAIEPEPAAVTA